MEKCHDIISTRYNTDSWNVYVFQCSDGDNWPEDNEKTINAARVLENCSQFFGYCEIEPRDKKSGWITLSNLSETYSPLVSDNFKIAEIRNKDDIWLAFQRFFGGFRE